MRDSQCNQQTACPFFQTKLTDRPTYSCLDTARLMNSSKRLEAFFFQGLKEPIRYQMVLKIVKINTAIAGAEGSRISPPVAI